MELETLLPLSMFAALLLLIMAGFPVAFTLSGTALIYAVLGYYFDIFMLSDFGFISARIFGVIQNVTLIAVPLFIFMGVMLEKSGIARQLILRAEFLFQRVTAGLPIALIAVGALLAASTGIVGATVVTMGVFSLPALLGRGYDTRLSCGTIAASGTLGQIIPPSIVLVLLGDMMNVAVADLFAGALIPGLLLVICYMLYVMARIGLNPALGPDVNATTEDIRYSKLDLFLSIVPPLILMGLVLGTILSGIASPTESAACGAGGAVVLAFLRKQLSWSIMHEVAEQTTMMTTMVFTLLIGAQFFSVVFRGLYGDEILIDAITGLNYSPHIILLLVLLLMFILGFFLDFIEICFIMVPLLAPVLTELGFNPIWLGILFAVNLQTSFLTPPFGFSLFYLKGVAPEGVSTSDIFRGVLPFVGIQLFVLLLLFQFPLLVTALPEYFFG